MPALVQGLNIGRFSLDLPIPAHFQQVNHLIVGGKVVGKGLKIPISGFVGVVELTDRLGNLGQGGVIFLQSGEGLLGYRFPSGGAEGVDVSQDGIGGPGHFVTVNPYKCFVCHGSGSGFSFGPGLAQAGAVGENAAGGSVVKRAAVIGDSIEVQPGNLGGGGKGLGYGSHAVGDLGVAVKQAKIDVGKGNFSGRTL